MRPNYAVGRKFAPGIRILSQREYKNGTKLLFMLSKSGLEPPRPCGHPRRAERRKDNAETHRTQKQRSKELKEIRFSDAPRALARNGGREDFITGIPLSVIRRILRRANFHTHVKLLEPNHPIGTAAEIQLPAHGQKPRWVNEKNH